jgi:hypothetical protein
MSSDPPIRRKHGLRIAAVLIFGVAIPLLILPQNPSPRVEIAIGIGMIVSAVYAGMPLVCKITKLELTFFATFLVAVVAVAIWIGLAL